MDPEKAVDYLDKLADTQGGVSVATLDDGWLFHFSAETLRSLLEKAEASGKAVVFIQSSAKVGRVQN
jgi:predicted TIM-barrel fold metal-dependent hydrolase